MTSRRTLAILTVASLAGGSLASGAQASATLLLVEEDGLNEIDLELILEPLLPNATASTTVSGEVQITMEIDPQTDRVSELTVTSGMVTGEGVSLAGSRFLVGSYNFTSTELGGELSTLSPPGTVDPVTGEFDASEHSFTINQGTLDGSISIPLAGVSEDVSFDFAAEPIEGAGHGTGTITLVETGLTADAKEYEVTITIPIELTQTVEAAGVMVPLTAEGIVKAIGATSVPIETADPYAIWAQENGLEAGSFLADENRDGVPNGLQWGLGLDRTTLPFPFLLKPKGGEGESVRFTLSLPPTGSAADITVLATGDPASAPFVPLGTEFVDTGNPIPAGTSGVVTINLPPGPYGFIQLAVRQPGA